MQKNPEAQKLSAISAARFHRPSTANTRPARKTPLQTSYRFSFITFTGHFHPSPTPFSPPRLPLHASLSFSASGSHARIRTGDKRGAFCTVIIIIIIVYEAGSFSTMGDSGGTDRIRSDSFHLPPVHSSFRKHRVAALRMVLGQS